jgi:uracil-DNA glycosylase
MKTVRTPARQRKGAPASVWLAVYACGAFRCTRTESGANRAGSSGQAACCARGGHAFEVLEYPRRTQAAAAATVERRGEPLKLPVLMRRLQARVADCSGCGLSRTRTQTVFARGNPEASVCFVGEAPGAEEDAQGKPFVGRAGKLLDEMIKQMGLSPEKDVYICNIIKCRPPENRRPLPAEIEACSTHLHAQLALWSQWPEKAATRIIVALGKTAIATLLGSTSGVKELRGQWKLYRGRVMLMPTYHPSFLLRPFKTQERCRQEAANDLAMVAKELGLEGRLYKPRRPKLYAISGGRDATNK